MKSIFSTNGIIFIINNIQKNLLKCFLLITIFFVTIYKITLIGDGFLAFPDEFRYAQSGSMLKNLSEKDIKSSIINIFSAQGRPGDVLIKTIPNSVQFVTAKIFGLSYYERNNSFPLFIFNYLVYIGILVLTYRLGYHILKNNILTLFSVLTYGLFTNSYIYIRHALPYDASLFICLFVIYKLIVSIDDVKMTFSKLLCLGFCSFFGYLVYPGYIPLYIISLIILFYKFRLNNLRIILSQLLFYSLGSIACLSLFELLSRFGGSSYINSALHLSTTVTQGSFEESFVFFIKYLIAVENLSGIILLISLVLFYSSLIKYFVMKDIENNSLILVLGTSILGLYLLYASTGYYLSKVVFYGRLIHQYLPFLCIFMAVSLNNTFNNSRIKYGFLLIISIVGIYNFIISIEYYKSYSYPRDVSWNLIKEYPNAKINTIFEYENSWSVMPKPTNFKPIQNEESNQIYLINCCYFYPINNLEKYHEFKPNSNLKYYKSYNHFLNFKAYQYEGYSIQEREYLDRLSFKIKVFYE